MRSTAGTTYMLDGRQYLARAVGQHVDGVRAAGGAAVAGTLSDLREQFGDIDIYVFDQLLRRRIAPGMRVLDAGCGSGRNIVYLLRSGYEVFGVDADPNAVQAVRQLASEGRTEPRLRQFPRGADRRDHVSGGLRRRRAQQRGSPFCPRRRAVHGDA